MGLNALVFPQPQPANRLVEKDLSLNSEAELFNRFRFESTFDEENGTTDRSISGIARYEALVRLLPVIGHHHGIRELTSLLAAEVSQLVKLDFIGVSRYDEAMSHMEWHLAKPEGATKSGTLDATTEDAMAAWVYQNQKPLLIPSLDRETRLRSKILGLVQDGILSICAVPLSCTHHRLGCLFIGSVLPNAYSPEEVRFLSLIATQVFGAIENNLAYGQIEELKDKLEQQSLYLEDETREEHGFSEIVGHSRVLHPDDVERVGAARKHGLAGSEPFEVDARLLGKDGTHRWFLGRYNPFVEESRVRRWYVTATEIESRKQEEERVRKENVRLEERTRIAQELHDTLLQTFQSALLHLGAALDDMTQDSPFKPELDRTLQIMRQGIEEGRSAIQGLRSSGSETSDLVVALSRIQEELEQLPDIDFRVIVTGCQRQLPQQIQDEIYRIGREALGNAFCHSGAKRIELELEYSDTELRMRIRDNGCGIDPQVLEKGRDGHWGVAGMRERATRIGGLVKILSSPMAGTEVQLSIPSSVAFHPANF